MIPVAEQRPPVIAWRLRVLMAERDVHTTRALRKRLADYGIVRSEPQLGRIVKGLPRSMDMQVLSALCAVLDVTPGDLLIIPGRCSPGRQNLPAANVLPSTSVSAPGLSGTDPVDLTAIPTERPRATAFPRPKY